MPSYIGRRTPQHPNRHLARIRTPDLCRQALGIVVLVVVVVGARCVLQLHLRIQLSGWGNVDRVGRPGAGVQGGEEASTRLARSPARKRVRCGGRHNSSSLNLRPRFRLVYVRIHCVNAVSVTHRGALFVVVREVTHRAPGSGGYIG
jgi:hypothetical protein